MTGIVNWKVREVVSNVYEIYVKADSEKGAIAIAQDIPKKDWEDKTDERLPDQVEAEEYE